MLASPLLPSSSSSARECKKRKFRKATTTLPSPLISSMARFLHRATLAFTKEVLGTAYVPLTNLLQSLPRLRPPITSATPCMTLALRDLLTPGGFPPRRHSHARRHRAPLLAPNRRGEPHIPKTTSTPRRHPR